jgi:hypothetical protein
MGAESKDPEDGRVEQAFMPAVKGARVRLQPLRWFSGRSLITISF